MEKAPVPGTNAANGLLAARGNAGPVRQHPRQRHDRHPRQADVQNPKRIHPLDNGGPHRRHAQLLPAQPRRSQPEEFQSERPAGVQF